VPTDFWEEARARLNRVKPVMMLSEGTLPEHHMKAFDLTYSWTCTTSLIRCCRGRGRSRSSTRSSGGVLQFPRGALRMRFNTNHDKNAWDAPAVVKFGPRGFA